MMRSLRKKLLQQRERPKKKPMQRLRKEPKIRLRKKLQQQK
jgi:hypothetical protein